MDRTERYRKDQPEKPPKAHILGVRPSSLPSLVQALRQNGLGITIDPDQRGGASSQPAADRRSQRLPRATSLLLHGEDIPREHSARLAAFRDSIPQRTPLDMIRMAMQGRIGVVVAGGRLAGLTAAMIGWVLAHSGKDPSVLLEKPSKQMGGCARPGEGVHFVTEWSGDLHQLAELQPSLTLFLDLDADTDRETEQKHGVSRETLDAFRKGSQLGLVLALGHPSRLLDSSSFLNSTDNLDLSTPLETFSLRRGSAWWGTDLRLDPSGPRFRVFHHGDFVVEVRLQVLGIRHVVSALAAVSACRALGISSAEIGAALEEFQGSSHEFERRGSFRGVNLVNDPADNPGTIRETLDLARQTFRSRRIWAVLSPPWLDPEHDSRDIPRFASALSGADRILFVNGPASKSQERFDGSEGSLIKSLNTSRQMASQVSGLVEAVETLDQNLEPGDVLLTLGTGELGTIADAFIRRLSRDRQGR